MNGGNENMKLLIAIVNSNDANQLSSALTDAGMSITKLATTGGFLKQGNTTFFMGIDDERVDEALEIIKKYSGVRTEVQPIHHVSAYPSMASTSIETKVGGAVVFVTDVERFEKL